MIERGLSEASASTIWRWLHDDALKPWQQRSWIFVRGRRFAEKTSRVLDLYQRRFEGRRLRDFDSLETLAERLLSFSDRYRQIARPFDWTFTRTDLDRLLTRIDAYEPELRLAA